MDANIYESFLEFVRLGIGISNPSNSPGIDAMISKGVDWTALKALADCQGLSAVVLDGLNVVQEFSGSRVQGSLPLQMKLEWIGEVLQGEQAYKQHQEVAADMAKLFHWNGIRTYVLKGRLVAECYPKPEHRVSSDMDCYLIYDNLDFNDNMDLHEEAWRKGNELIRAKGFEVNDDFYKNSTFHLPGLMVENHRYLVPFRGNERLKRLEELLQSWIHGDTETRRVEGTCLYRSPVMVSTLFLIEHAYSHFLHEGLTWRMVLDWVLFSKRYKNEIDWALFEGYVDKFGFRKFYDAFNAIGMETFGDSRDDGTGLTGDPILFRNQPLNLSGRDHVAGDSISCSGSKLREKMLADIWAPLDLHETVHGVKGKFALAGNTWRARWKYRYFTHMNWMQALWIQARGVMFDRHPVLK